MFKRVDRRRKRKENEERLGLDEDQWGVFGLHHTDSSESESDSSDSASTSSSDGHSTKKRKRGASPPSYDENSEEDDGESEPAVDDEEDEEGSNNYGTHPSLTIASALKDPIRPIEPHSEAWMCVLCPGKTLKHATMVKVHETSRIHQRRFKRMQELAMDFSPEQDIQNVLEKPATETQPKASEGILSLRAEKKKAKQERLKEKRKKIKEKKAAAKAKANAKKAAETVRKEDLAGHPSDMDEAINASKRLKAASSDLPGRAKKVRRTSLQGDTRKIPAMADRRNSKETTKSPVPGKSKKRRRMVDETTPAH